MQGEIYDSRKGWGKTIYDTQVCGSGRACFNMFKSEGHSVIARQKGKTINVTSLLYKTRADWPPPQYAAENKPTLKCRSRLKN